MLTYPFELNSFVISHYDTSINDCLSHIETYQPMDCLTIVWSSISNQQSLLNAKQTNISSHPHILKYLQPHYENIGFIHYNLIKRQTNAWSYSSHSIYIHKRLESERKWRGNITFQQEMMISTLMLKHTNHFIGDRNKKTIFNCQILATTLHDL
jgi:uncharacterized protein (UPF0332 family)